MGLFSKPKPADFWNWFIANADRLRTGDIQRNYMELLGRFEKLKLDIIIEIGAGHDGEPWQLVVSADGISDRIPKVESFVGGAPQIPGWVVVAFRQPAAEGFRIDADGKEVSPETSLYEVTGRPQGLVSVKLFLPLPANAPKEAYDHVGFLLLDHILGELAVMTKLGQIEMAHTTLAGPMSKPMSDLANELN